MKNDLATAILAAIVGFLIAYFACNFIVEQMGFIGQAPTYPAIDSTVSTDLAEPNPEVFNYRALNPTVEVYVGDCTEYDSYGNCVNNDENNTNNSNNQVLEIETEELQENP